MTTIAPPSRARIGALLALTASVYLLEVLVLPRLGARLPERLVAAAVTFDLALVVPAAWWLFVLRGTPRGARLLLPMVAVSLTLAAMIVPAGARSLLSSVRLMVLPVEVLVALTTVRAVVSAVRLARGGGDLAESIDAAMTRTLGDHAVSRALAAEMTAVVHALFSRRLPARPGSFTLEASRVPAFTWGLSLATVVESALVHLLLAPSHPLVAWTLTALGAYAVLWLVGQDRALSSRRVDVDEDALVLRAGLRLTARVPWPCLATATRASGTTSGAPGHLDAARPAEANVTFQLVAPHPVTGFLGVRRQVTQVSLCVDDPDGLLLAIAAARESCSPR